MGGGGPASDQVGCDKVLSFQNRFPGKSMLIQTPGPYSGSAHEKKNRLITQERLTSTEPKIKTVSPGTLTHISSALHMVSNCTVCIIEAAHYLAICNELLQKFETFIFELYI